MLKAREAFFACASQVMRSVILNRVCERTALKRDGDPQSSEASSPPGSPQRESALFAREGCWSHWTTSPKVDGYRRQASSRVLVEDGEEDTPVDDRSTRYLVMEANQSRTAGDGRLRGVSGQNTVSTLVSNPALPKSTYRHLPPGRFLLNGCFRCSWVLLGADSRGLKIRVSVVRFRPCHHSIKLTAAF